MTWTREELAAITQRANGRVGLEVLDHDGRSYWITDVSADERLRVVGEDGVAYWFNPITRTAKPIRTNPKKKSRAV